MLRYTKNKKAFHDYTVLDTIEAGIKLTGSEVKSIRNNQIQLKGSYVVIKDGQLYLTGAHISKPSNIMKFDNHQEDRDRILLVKKKEILKLHQRVQEKGLTLIALEVYQPDSSNKIKVKVGVCKGNRDYDKRQIIKQKQAIMESKREMKNY